MKNKDSLINKNISHMTSIINNENENINLEPNNMNKENCPNNLDEFIYNQINIAKNHKNKQNQNQLNKGLGVLDQNNNLIKKSTTFNLIMQEAKKEKLNNNPLLGINSDIAFLNLNNNIFDNANLLNNNNQVNPPLNDEMIISSKSSKSDIEIVSSSKEKENDNIIIFSNPNYFENNLLSESEHKKIADNLKKIEKSITPLNININKMFNKRESNNLLLKCGESSYKYNKFLEESIFKIPSNFLSKHKINPYIRTKMVDWMIEVLSVFDASEETFFLSVNIMDLFLWKTPNIYKSENVHLIGVGSMFIASKFQEIYPISLKEFVHKIGHDQFNTEDVKKMECKILKDIKPECLVSTSVYDFCKTYFYDFYYNNKNLIISKEDVKIYEYIKLTSIYLNKLILHYEFFYIENCSIKAIGCIVASMKIVCDCLNEKFPQKTKGIYNDWMLFLIEQGGFNRQKVEVLANKIYTAYQHYQKSKSISKNLNKFTPLPFIKLL